MEQKLIITIMHGQQHIKTLIKCKSSEPECESHRQPVPQHWQVALTQQTSVRTGLGRPKFLLPFAVFSCTNWEMRVLCILNKGVRFLF